MGTQALGVQELEEIKPEIAQISSRSQEIEINNQNEYEMAIAFARSIKERYSHLDDLRRRITRPLDDAKKGVMDLFRIPTEILSSSEYMVKSKMLQYQHKQEEWRIKEESRLRKEADDEREKLLKKAQKLENQGYAEKAEEIKQQAAEVVAPPSIQLTIAPVGISTRVIWKARIIDANLVPRTYLIPDENMLNSMARASKGIISIPGVEFYADESVTIKR
jgi:hypothetical protein